MAWWRRRPAPASDVEVAIDELISLVRDVDQKMDALSADARAVFAQVTAIRLLREEKKKP